MLKGIGKQIVVIKNPKSKYFDEAIFIIKDGATSPETDILEECERIIKDNSLNIRKNKQKASTSITLMALSIISIITMIIILIFLLV